MKTSSSLALIPIACAALWALPLSAQDAKPEHRFFLGGGAGISWISSSRVGETASGAGASLAVLAGYRFSGTASATLEYIGHRPKDETPLISDVVIEKTAVDGAETRRLVVVRIPKILRTDLLLLSFQAVSKAGFYFRLSAGLGLQSLPDYAFSEDAVTAAMTASRASYAYGLAVGHEFRLSARTAIALEARTLWSSGGGAPALRTILGAGAALRWDVF